MKIAVVIPSFRVKKHILDVIRSIGKEVEFIFVVDDCCPESSGEYVVKHCKDKRVQVIFHKQNQGVGGAMVTGYKAALDKNAEIIVKIDGDGQMDPKLLPLFIKPIVDGEADYTKGNRFYNPDFLARMPKLRLIGNGGLSFINKLVSGYWDIMDPTNGYTAIHKFALQMLPLDKIDKRYFFESDMLFRLNIARAVVTDIPMFAVYGEEESNLRIKKVLFEFPVKYLNRLFKRIFYNYFLRDFNLGSLEILFGFSFFSFGVIFGIKQWFHGYYTNTEATSGTVMVAALPIILGFQLVLSALQYDVLSIPKKALVRIGNRFK
ncbi:glycosyl transferase family 2 [Leptospira ryugenii]|uniref:Glycosyl transferase family 2 n=1 Tax=Leptospira ryugenii TaxID=1917863 RepID=A0A2P2DWA8_9LEPT|nr:glycosyltransferase family 2 protein [Leptospira ryugenii]GBF48850.1 glycosyl transferase family 2 [Leptospira ryugenii]